MNTRTDQRNAKAGGHIAGRDVHINERAPRKIDDLLRKLQQQVEHEEHARETIQELARYQTRRAHDGVEGLKKKLEAGNRSHTYVDAIEKKEMFVKLLEKWSLYSSAQYIFAHFLAKAENEFSQVVHPQIPEKTEAEINALVIERIVLPIIDECGADVFSLDYNLVLGMVYWLAEQCFVRWHK